MAGKTHPDTLRGLALMAAGKSVREAASLVDVAPSTLSRALAKTGAAARRPGRKPGKSSASRRSLKDV